MRGFLLVLRDIESNNATYSRSVVAMYTLHSYHYRYSGLLHRSTLNAKKGKKGKGASLIYPTFNSHSYMKYVTWTHLTLCTCQQYILLSSFVRHMKNSRKYTRKCNGYHALPGILAGRWTCEYPSVLVTTQTMISQYNTHTRRLLCNFGSRATGTKLNSSTNEWENR